jgi:hypothetical protein
MGQGCFPPRVSECVVYYLLTIRDRIYKLFRLILERVVKPAFWLIWERVVKLAKDNKQVYT